MKRLSEDRLADGSLMNSTFFIMCQTGAMPRTPHGDVDRERFDQFWARHEKDLRAWLSEEKEKFGELPQKSAYRCGKQGDKDREPLVGSAAVMLSRAASSTVY